MRSLFLLTHLKMRDKVLQCGTVPFCRTVPQNVRRLASRDDTDAWITASSLYSTDFMIYVCAHHVEIFLAVIYIHTRSAPLYSHECCHLLDIASIGATIPQESVVHLCVCLLLPSLPTENHGSAHVHS